MSAKRRDNKNHILRNGESQRKDGRYMYKYIDNAGNAKHVYSWKLVKTDTVPQGARDDIPLRDKVKLSDAKGWLIKLQADGRGYSTIHTVRGVVRPAF